MKKGFTLAETLITATIIGVVAAMTLPIFVNNYQKDVFAKHLQKLALDFENAADVCAANSAKAVFANAGAFSKAHNCANCEAFMKTYINATKTDNIFATSYRSIDGKSVTNDFTCDNSYLTPDNISLCVTEKTTALGDFSPYFELVADLNGKSRPNLSGRDFFKFYLDEFGTVTGIQPDITMENINKSIEVLLNNTSYDCPPYFNIDANGDGNCDIDDLSYLIDLKLSSKQTQNKCIENSDGSNCFSILQDNSWVMDY